jgi:hypothetical protein
MVILDVIDGGIATEDERSSPVQHLHELVRLGNIASGWSRDSSGHVLERVAGSSQSDIVCHCLVSGVPRYRVEGDQSAGEGCAVEDACSRIGA